MRARWGGFVISAFAAAMLPVVAASDAPPQTNIYHDDSHGYSLTLPNGWSPMADDTLQGAMRGLLKPGSPIRYVAGFQRDDARFPFDYPYALVQVISYAEMGVKRQITRSEFDKAVKAFTGTAPKELADTVADPVAADMVEQSELSEPRLDRERGRYLFDVSSDVNLIGKVHGRAVGLFGRDSIVQVMFYDKAGAWEATATAWAPALESLAFDEAHAYDPSLDSWRNSPVVSGTLSGALLGGIIGLAAALFAGWKKRHNQAT